MLIVCRSLKRELVRAQEEIKRIQSVPLVIGQFMEAIDQKYASLRSRSLKLTNQHFPKYWYCSI
jgi:ATP-dependent 26S proteasome regulatory subunit